jgi:hypothetical protein
VKLQRSTAVERQIQVADVHRLSVVLREHGAATESEPKDPAMHSFIVTN